MSGDVWLGCLRVAGDVFIPNKLAQIFIVHVSSDVTCSSSACSYVKTPMSGGVWMVSVGV